MRAIKRFAIWASLAIVAVGCATPPEQDPVVQRMAEMDGRLLRIERILSNQSLLEQSQRVDALYNEVRGLRGQLEQMQHTPDSSRDQQRAQYADVDKRLQALETRGVTAVAAAPVEDDATAYKKAFDTLREGKYQEATAAFGKFLTDHPQSTLLDNAYYWLGEARYVGKDYAQALKEFRAVIDRFPDSRKLQDAWLKVGYCQYELKNWKESRDALKRAQDLGADTPTGKLAEQRLAKLKAEGR
jgi:tol-pal system protein YbgF